MKTSDNFQLFSVLRFCIENSLFAVVNAKSTPINVFFGYSCNKRHALFIFWSVRRWRFMIDIPSDCLRKSNNLDHSEGRYLQDQFVGISPTASILTNSIRGRFRQTPAALWLVSRIVHTYTASIELFANCGKYLVNHTEGPGEVAKLVIYDANHDRWAAENSATHGVTRSPCRNSKILPTEI
jgi:hypothetical protein